MKLIVHSDSPKALACFKRVERGGEFELVQEPAKDFRKSVRDCTDLLIIYVDIQGLTDAERKRAVKYLTSHEDVLAGIIDHKGIIEDVAELFHEGIFDYVGKSLWRDGVTLKRLRNAVDAFAPPLDDEEEIDNAPRGELILTKNWDTIVAEREYTFCFMFFELDLNQDWKTKSGREHLDRVIASLEANVERTVSAAGGRLWMWAEYGGLALFPFDGKRCESIMTCFRMMLNRTIISAEDFEFDTLLSYRIALHIGNTVYRPRGKTGTIISDSVNFIFHLGHQFAEPGGLYLSENVRPFVPPGLEGHFVDCGLFEGKRVFRMRRRAS